MFLALLLTVVSQVAQPSQEGPVWFWFTSCGGPTMSLEVAFDRQVISKSSFPLCHEERSSNVGRGAARKIIFVFKPDKPIKWIGYRDDNPVSPRDEPIRCDIWLAGSDPDDLLLGVSFLGSNKMIYMNTIHIAHPDQRDQSEIAEGLVVTTRPTKSGA